MSNTKFDDAHVHAGVQTVEPKLDRNAFERRFMAHVDTVIMYVCNVDRRRVVEATYGTPIDSGYRDEKIGALSRGLETFWAGLDLSRRRAFLRAAIEYGEQQGVL